MISTMCLSRNVYFWPGMLFLLWRHWNVLALPESLQVSANEERQGFKSDIFRFNYEEIMLMEDE